MNTNKFKIKPTSKFSIGFTLIEILVVVIVISILAGVAVWKLGDAKDTSEVNFLVTSINHMERGMEAVMLIEGSFPEVTGNTHEERIISILTILKAKNYMVHKTDDYIHYFANIDASKHTTIQSIIKANASARKGLPSGSPEAREILTWPSETVIPSGTPISLFLNDPNAPNNLVYGGSDNQRPGGGGGYPGDNGNENQGGNNPGDNNGEGQGPIIPEGWIDGSGFSAWETDISGRDFRNYYNVTGVNFNGASNYIGANFEGLDMTGFDPAAHGTGRSLQDVNLSYTTGLDGAMLNNAAALGGANLEGIDLTGFTNPLGRSLQGANLSNTIGFNPSVLNGSTSLNSTKLRNLDLQNWSSLGYKSLANADFTGSTNINLDIFNQASTVAGVILTDTGITAQMLLNAGVPQWKINSMILD